MDSQWDQQGALAQQSKAKAWPFPTGNSTAVVNDLEHLEELLKFYQVKSVDELFIVMENHIGRLQNELKKYKPDYPYYTKVREG